MRHRLLEAVMDGDKIAAVRFEDRERPAAAITAGYVLDATEEGDLLP